MEWISSCATTLLDHSLPAIGRQCGYLWNYDKNVNSLKDQLEKLDDVRKGMSLSVADAERNVETIRSQTITWRKEANKIREGAKTFIEECEKEQKRRCMMGLCPNPISRYRFGRRACKKKTDIETVMREADQITKVADPAVGLAKKVALSTEGLVAFESRTLIMDNIMKVLQDETKNCIGVYGFGGMGKTTLAKQVAARADEGNMFDEVVFAPVTQKVELKQIQEKIASQLDLKLNGFTEAEYAGRICERLKGKKVLVILDDLWKELGLNDVGIPFGTEHRSCKLLLTSRFQPVLASMGTRIYFNLGALEEEEAWRLFEDKAGSVLRNSDFHNIGMQVAKRCQGLPVLIVTVAASLSKRKQLPVWNDALNQLKKMNHKEIHDIVNSAIESISYNHLEKTHKQLILLCGVMGGVASIEEVLQCSWGLNWFDEVSVTIHEARNRLHTLIVELQEYCLLLDVDVDVEGRNSIKMHDVVRDVAISIGRKESNMLSMGDYDLWCKDEYLKKCTAMVLRGCPNLPDVPPHLECPLLELFVMSGFSWDSSPSIPETFFEKTVKLQVLGLSRLSFSVLPPSLSFLKNLQTLRVNDCYNLKDLSIVGELKKLQILSLAGSCIEELPSGIGQLTELRSLDVRGCYKLKVIPAGLIKGLTRLEELYVSRRFNRWEAEVCVNGSMKTNASLRELKHLHNLCCLEVRANDDTFLLEDLHLEKLERYEIIAWKDLHLDRMEVTRKFCVQFSSTSINHLQQGFKRLFERTEYLWLGEVKGINNMIPALVGDSFSNLKHLRIEKDYEIQYVVNGEDKQRKAVFPCLESLHLDNLMKLQKICNGTLMEESFQNLTSVEVSNCNGLKSLFSFSMVTRLSRLREINVRDCNALEAIVAEKNINDDGVNINDGVREEIEFSQLRELTLNRLPNLKNFFFTGEIQNKSQKSLSPEIHREVEEEFKSILPFFAKVSFPKLEQLFVSGISNLTEIPDTCCNLKRLTIRQCKNLNHVFPAHVGPYLNKLEYLGIQDCEAVETIIGDEIIKAARHEHASATFMFSKLTTMWLQKLPKLKCFYPRKHTIECPELTDVSVADCGNLSTFDILSFPSKRGDDLFEKVMSKLKSLNIRSTDLENIQRLYDGHFPPHLFSRLKSLSIVGSDVFPSKFLGMILKQLERFVLHGCSFQEIFPYEGEFTNHANDHTLFLPQLEDLSLEKLPQLKYICKHNQKKSLILNIIGRLKFISVEECPLLTSLEQPSTARSLERLIFLTISGCEKMEKVIGDDYELSRDGDNEIIFPNLEYLELEKLPRLTNFCSSPNYTFNFPELILVIVRECPNMKTFCRGTTTTPMLEKVKYDGEECWDGEELNTTLQKVCAERFTPSTIHGDLNTTLQKVCAEAQSPRLIPTLPSTSLINQEAEIHGNAAEPTNEQQVVGEISEQGTFTENAIEPRIETEICAQHVVPSSNTNLEVEAQLHYESSKKVSDDPIIEGQVHENAAENSAKMEVRELASLLPSTSSTNHIEAAGQVPEISAEAQAADIFEKGFVASPEETNPPAQTSLSHSTELEVRRSTLTVESEATDPKQGSEIVEEVLQGVNLLDKTQEQLHPPISNTLQVTSQQKDRIHVKSAEKVNDEPIREAEIGVENYVNEAEICDQEVVGEGQVADAVSLPSQPYDELSPCATPEVQRLPSKVPNNLKMKKARNPIHGPNWFTNWKRTLYILWLLGLFITGSIWALMSFSDHSESPAACEEAAPILLEHFNLTKNQPHALDSPFSKSDQRSTSTVESEATDSKNGSEIDEEVLQGVKLADIYDKAQEQLHPPISNTIQVTSQQKDRIHVKSAENVNDEPIREAEIGDQEVVKEGQVADARDKGKEKEYDVAEETVEPRNETSDCLEIEPETSTAASSSHQESFRGLRESFQILEAQPMSRVSAEQVRFMEEASEWLCGYVKQARQYLEQKELISELELKIEDMEAQLQELKEKKIVAEDKKNVASHVAKFG